MSVNPSGLPTLTRRLRGRAGEAAAAAPPLPPLLVKDVQQALRRDAAETPRRVLLAESAAAAFKTAAAAAARLRAAAGTEVMLAYSIKTNPSPLLLSLARDHGLWAEAIAQSEVTHALSHGFAADQIVLNGPGKWWPAPVKIPSYGAVYCDSVEELRRAGRDLAKGHLAAAFLGIRLRPATVHSRFGIPLHEPGLFRDTVRLLNRLPRRQAVGFHFHIASSMIGVKTWQSLADQFLAAVRLLCDQVRGRDVAVSLGGGWHPDDWDGFLDGSLAELIAACRRVLPRVRLVILEPGKALSQRSMCLLTRVLEVRPRRWSREIVVDASVAELPDLRSHPHPIVSLSRSGRVAAWKPGYDRVFGRLCMEYDILSEALAAPDHLRAGDAIAFLNAGAYDASMAYSFGRGGGRLQ